MGAFIIAKSQPATTELLWLEIWYNVDIETSYKKAIQAVSVRPEVGRAVII